MAGFGGDRVVFVHAAGVVEPIGFAGETDAEAYQASVLLNSASPQVLGHLFLGAVREVEASRHLVILTSGAAASVYPGWSAYGAGKAAVDHWVRHAGDEQSRRGGVQVLAVAPGTVDTGMQAQIRATDAADFTQRQKFLDLHEAGQLADPADVARRIWALLDRPLDNGSVVDLRKLSG
jgi:NAD(P)-dependent dehydrogenase (short-subunit alcohol dehydrogenase family)